MSVKESYYLVETGTDASEQVARIALTDFEQPLDLTHSYLRAMSRVVLIAPVLSSPETPRLSA
jgi:hypothetical protein